MTLLTGPAGSGKTRRVLSEFRAALHAASCHVRLLVPTATLSEHLRHELARDGLVFRSRQLATLAHFLEEIAPQIKTVAAEHFPLMVEKAVLETGRAEFEKVRDLAGFHTRLAATIADLDSAGCTPAILGRLPGSVAPFRDAVRAVWSHVERQMHQREVVTRGESLRRIASLITTLNEQLPQHIWMDGFAQFSGPEIDLICALGGRTHLTVTLPDEGVPASLQATLIERGFVEEKLSGGRSPVRESVVPETAEREADEVCRRVLECSSQGTAFRDIGVVLRQPAKYEPLLRAAFERFGIPVHFYFNEPLATHSAGRLLSGIVDQMLQAWEHEATIGLLRLAPWVGSSTALDGFEIRVREALPGRGLDALLQLAKNQRMLTRPLQNLARLNNWTKLTDTPANWAARLASLPSLFWPGYLADGVAPEEAARFRSQAAGYRAFSDAMDLAALWWLDPAARLRLAEFWPIANAVIDLTTVKLPTRARNAVHVISAYEARQWDLAAVFVCGLVEKEFPAQNGGNPFFSDAALKELQSVGVRVRTSLDNEEEERGLFDAVCARARDLLVFSYPRLDSRGQRSLPSLFFPDAARLTAPVTVPPIVRPQIAEPVARWLQPSRLVSNDLIGALLERHNTLSVTALEKLLQCPFQFFADRVLKVGEMPNRPEDRLDFLLQGNIAHQVLNDWFVTRPPLEPLFANVFDRICQDNRVQPGFRTERQRRTLLLAMRRFANDVRYPPPAESLTEQAFTYEVDPTLYIKGKLDRIDVLQDGRAVIVDYKYSKATTSKKNIEDDTKLQGPLYALALQEHFHRKPAAMVYISLKDEELVFTGWGEIPGLATPLLPIPENWLDDTLQRVHSAVSEFRSGAIQPRPARTEPCRYCTFRDSCRIGLRALLPDVEA